MKILVIVTGGTFGSSETSEGLSAKEIYYQDDLRRIAEKKFASDIELQFISPFLKLSENILPEDWSVISNIIVSESTQIDAALVLHGTDTMAYTAAAISYCEEISKRLPIVLTGSNYPVAKQDSDAVVNFLQSIAWLKHLKNIGTNGCFIVFNGSNHLEEPAFLHPGTRVKKDKCEGSCYRSFYYEQGSVGQLVGLSNADFNYTRYSYMFPKGIVNKTVVPRFEPRNVFAIKIYSGLYSGYIRPLVDAGLKILLLELYNSGTGPVEGRTTSLLSDLDYAKEKDVVVFGLSQHEGNLGASMDIYESSYALRRAGVICLKDMLWEAALPKAMIANYNFRERNDLIAYMTANIAGEVNA